MKKKIKDLTQQERFDICASNYGCKWCPLFDNNKRTKICHLLNDIDYNREFLEKEVEV